MNHTMSKSWPTYTAPRPVDLNNPLGHQTEPCISTLVKMTPDGRIEGRKRRDLPERLDKSPKKSKSSGGPKPGPSHFVSGESSLKFGLLIVPSSDSSIIKRSNKRKSTSDESEGPSSKKSRTTSPEESPTQEPSETCDSPRISGTDRKEDFLEKYQELEVLGHGGFATVFSGIRIKDSFPVAIKHVQQRRLARTTMDWNGKSTDVPLEVALLIQVGAGPHDTESSITPLLLDWFDLEDELIMVFEKPENCMDLDNYLKTTDKPLSETHVKVIMKQLVDAAITMDNKGVFHRDIKPHNILIETSSEEPRVRYIDFGCGVTFTPGQRFRRNAGTRIYNSPEWFMYGFCSAEYTTAWQLGVVMYQLLHNKLPFDCDYKIINQNPPILADISNKCRDFLTGCLRKHYKDRFTVEDLRNHMWLK
ncbi:serine/threonine-protein kinase pim-2-like [Astatotilapia calliptera]|uniref:serine/threonine-protein kinase pim-2-like n=1 Tax=Astatotilapia calliptera TaxID=8154 RepID=UPI000E3FA3C5|nr:serine/threonine-protein kinase pim-2-like [Astatotilapia calliptera]